MAPAHSAFRPESARTKTSSLGLARHHELRTDQLRTLATVHNNLAFALSLSDQLEEALIANESSVRILESVVAIDPSDDGSRRKLLRALEARASYAERLGSDEIAEAARTRMAEIRER